MEVTDLQSETRFPGTATGCCRGSPLDQPPPQHSVVNIRVRSEWLQPITCWPWLAAYPLITLQFPRQSVTESPGWSLRPFVLRLGFSCSSSWAKHCCTFTGLLTNSSSPGRGRHPKLPANLGVPLEGREAGIRLRHRMVVESQQMEENGRSPVGFHRRGSESRLWNIFSFWVLSVMDYRQPISQAALLPPEIFFFFYIFLFPFFGGGVQLCVCLSCHVTRVHNTKRSSLATRRFGCDSSSRSREQNQRSEWRIAGV